MLGNSLVEEPRQPETILSKFATPIVTRLHGAPFLSGKGTSGCKPKADSHPLLPRVFRTSASFSLHSHSWASFRTSKTCTKWSQVAGIIIAVGTPFAERVCGRATHIWSVIPILVVNTNAGPKTKLKWLSYPLKAPSQLTVTYWTPYRSCCSHEGKAI